MYMRISWSSHDHIYIAFKKDVVLRPNKLLSCVCKILIPSNMSLDNSSPLSYYVQNRSIWLMFILLYWRLAYLITAVNRVFSVGIYLQNLITFNGCKHWPPDCPQSCNVVMLQGSIQVVFCGRGQHQNGLARSIIGQSIISGH